MSRKLSVPELQEMISRSRFHQLFRPEIMRADNDRLELVVRFFMSAELERQPGTNQWHGGAVSAIVDTTGCYGLALLTGEPLPTIDFRTDYMRPAVGTNLTATAKVRKAGRSVAVVDIDVVDDNDRLIAVGRASYSTKDWKSAD